MKSFVLLLHVDYSLHGSFVCTIMEINHVNVPFFQCPGPRITMLKASLGMDHLNFWGGGWGGGGGWVIFGETVFFFFFCRKKTGYFFFERFKDRIFFLDKVKAGFFFFFIYNHMNHYQCLIRTCILNFSFINFV